MIFKERKDEYIECHKTITRTQKEIDRLIKKYQGNPDTFIKDYDTMIYENLIGILANWNANKFIRNDIISWVNDLIKFREEIINFNCNYCGSDNQK